MPWCNSQRFGAPTTRIIGPVFHVGAISSGSARGPTWYCGSLVSRQGAATHATNERGGKAVCAVTFAKLPPCRNEIYKFGWSPML
jgi:hypothetical protein